MANQTRGNSGFPNFFPGFPGGDARRQFIDGPAEAARGEALATLLEVAGLMTVLPNAVIASQQRELERLKATRGDDDPRVAELQASLERAATLSAMAERGQARAQRAAVALADSDDVFHGFVSDSDLNPLPGLTVRAGKQFSATTDAEGYFRIPLGTKTKRGAGLGDILKNLNRRSGKAAAEAAADPGKDPAKGQVEIVRKGTVVHTDPIPVPLDQGRVYREYVVPKKPATARDFKNFIARNTPAEAPAGKRAPRGKTKRKK